MSKRITKLLLEDIHDCINSIETYTENVSFENFINDRKTYEATLFNFHLLGEAASQIPNDLKLKHPDIEWSEIIAFRNKLIHEYFGTSNLIIWDIIKFDLPQLKIQIQTLLDSNNYE